MKSREILKLIESAGEKEIRENCDVYRNTIELVFSLKESEQLAVFQSIFLYSFYGIEPIFDEKITKNVKDFACLKLIFSLLKNQRIGWVNSNKSANKGKFAPLPTPSGYTTDQDIKIKDKKSKDIKTKDKEESLLSSSLFLNIYNQTSKPFGEISLSGSQTETISGRTETEIKAFWGEVEQSEWLKDQPFGKVLNLFDNVVSGQYRGKAESVLKSPTREEIERIING